MTEYNVILWVTEPLIYVLTEEGWKPAQSYLALWYDSMTDFADIQPDIVEELKLKSYKII